MEIELKKVILENEFFYRVTIIVKTAFEKRHSRTTWFYENFKNKREATHYIKFVKNNPNLLRI
jgi:hypothetical protein